jgi:hypothetical protein
MAFTVNEITNLNTHVLETYLNKGEVFKQNVSNKPMLEAFNAKAGKFAGGNVNVSFAIKGTAHAGSLVGYTHDDVVGYYNPIAGVRAKFPWKEHHIGTTITHTELKIAGIDVIEDDAKQTTREMNGREDQLLVDIIDDKRDELGEDYAFSLDNLLHGDGTGDAKAIAGIASLLLANPAAGSTGGLNRVTYPYWRNRAATAAAFAAGSGPAAVISSAAAGGALITFMDKEMRFRNQYRNAQTSVRYFCGSSFIDAYKTEMRSNGTYTQTGWGMGKKPDGAMEDPNHAGLPLEWDPTLDALGLAKRCYAIDMGKTGVRLLYMDGQRMKKHNPARPFDRYVMYNGITMTGVLVAKQLNTSGVYDIA